MSEKTEVNIPSKSVWPALPIDLSHPGALCSYIGFFSLLFGIWLKSDKAIILFSFGCVLFGLGQLNEYRKVTESTLEGDITTTRIYYTKDSPSAHWGSIFSLVGFIFLIISVVLLLQ